MPKVSQYPQYHIATSFMNVCTRLERKGCSACSLYGNVHRMRRQTNCASARKDCAHIDVFGFLTRTDEGKNEYVF